MPCHNPKLGTERNPAISISRSGQISLAHTYYSFSPLLFPPKATYLPTYFTYTASLTTHLSFFPRFFPPSFILLTNSFYNPRPSFEKIANKRKENKRRKRRKRKASYLPSSHGLLLLRLRRIHIPLRSQGLRGRHLPVPQLRQHVRPRHQEPAILYLLLRAHHTIHHIRLRRSRLPHMQLQAAPQKQTRRRLHGQRRESRCRAVSPAGESGMGRTATAVSGPASGEIWIRIYLSIYLLYDKGSCSFGLNGSEGN